MMQEICKGCPTHVVNPTVSRSSAIVSHFTSMSHTVLVLSLETDGLYWFVLYVHLISVCVDILTSSGQTDNVLAIIGSKFAKLGTDLREFRQKELQSINLSRTIYLLFLPIVRTKRKSFANVITLLTVISVLSTGMLLCMTLTSSQTYG